MLEEIQDPNILFLVAKDNKNSLIGLFSGRIKEANCLHIYKLYVHPDSQGKGIGSKILNYATSYFPNLKQVELEVAVANSKGLNFWKNKGFAVVNKDEMKILKEVLPIYKMRKELK